ERLRELSTNSAIAMRKRMDEFTASAMVAFSRLGGQLNHVTGYNEIDDLKRRVREQEARIEETRKAAREAKAAYDDAVTRRAQSQKDVNDLLQRKSSWKDDDVARFTTLVRADHLHEQEEMRAKENLDRADMAVEREFSILMRAILDRYHEEQVWSDKIRSASTYGSLAALGLNLFVFITAIIIVEPWKRRRLAQTFEKKVEEMGMQTRAMFVSGMKELEDHLEEQEKRLVKV
ncbi:mitochondrial distribution and morphology family 33, partial [Punctularia strigosozonata HHB-11173 SS5]|uniref:mitochondrial distribution and morphology family 33 n=1 Tax=Punctularia strigosozonata (strain HHB-11173) TaxID=741275 RepID=UPI0004417638